MRATLFGLVATVGLGACLVCIADDPPKQGKPAGEKLLAKPDAFKTLVNPQCSHCVDEAKRRRGELQDDDRVLAWIRGKYEGGGIPMRFFLVPYRVISDTYGVFVYDADAGFVRGFEPSLDFTFYGWRNGVMVMKHKDGTLYSTLSGRAFDGPRKGDQLKPVATLETAWGYWSNTNPGTVAYHMFEKYQPIELPKAPNADSLSTRRKPSARLDDATMVLGVATDGATRAYPIKAIEKAGGLITDKLGDDQVVALWFKPTQSAAIYSTEIDESNPPQRVQLAVESEPNSPLAPFVDKATGSHFGIEGRAVDGPLKGKTLRWLPGVQCRWFAWEAEYPETQIYGSSRRGDGAATDSQSKDGVSRNESMTLSGIIVDAEQLGRSDPPQLKLKPNSAVVVVLDDQHDRAAYEKAARAVSDAGMQLFYWIEVARNPTMATEHPRWMASLGMHADWHERFPNSPLPGEGEVAKAFPWVPINYREAFDAQLDRVKRLLENAAGDYRGVLLNDLQGGPSSCGCGNLQCRWATDYHVPATGTKLDGNDTAAKFVAATRKLIAEGRTVTPVWTTECEDEDLPKKDRGTLPTTGYCGSVGCSQGTCPKAFTQQWSSLMTADRGAIAVLAPHKEFGRDRIEFGGTAEWITHAMDYLEHVPPQHGGVAIVPATPGIGAPGSRGPKPLSRRDLWLVVQGYDVSDIERSCAKQVAIETGAGAVLVALTRIDQSYEPRIIPVK